MAHCGARCPSRWRHRGGWNPLLEVREVTPTDFLKGVFTDCAWVRATTRLPDDPLVHRAGLTYLSDIGSGFGQKPRSLSGRGGPSIDHSMWFQEHIRADEWVLVDLQPIKARVCVGAIRARCAGLTVCWVRRCIKSIFSCRGRCPSSSTGSCGTRPRWRPRRGESPVTSRSCSGRTGTIQRGAEFGHHVRVGNNFWPYMKRRAGASSGCVRTRRYVYAFRLLGRRQV